MGRRANKMRGAMALALGLVVLAPAARAQPVTVAPVESPAQPVIVAPPEPPAQPVTVAPVEPPAQPVTVAPPAQPVMVAPPEPPGEEMPAFEPPPRPRMSLAVGMGFTRDPTGFSDGAHAVPAFFAEGGFGDGLGGFDMGAFASSASGRYPATENPVDRLALDAFGVVRPAARFRRDDLRYRMRVLHTVAAELGLGLERDGTTMASGTRFVIHTGARVELPLARAGQPSELRLRLAVRRAFGLYTPVITMNGETVSVGDSVEFYAALALIF